MPKDVVAAIIKGVMPTANGCAVFLGNDEKTFVIYVDHAVGNVIQMTLDGVKKERPLTHDLIGHILLGLGANLEHVIINDAREGTFFARILLKMENELGKKLIELDARPSDAIALSVKHRTPVEVAEEVLEESAEERPDVEPPIEAGEDDDDE